MFKYKTAVLQKYIALVVIPLLAAGCNLFGGTPAGAGVAKTVNGGDDWAFSNQAVVTVPSAKKNNKPAVSALAGANVTTLRFSPVDPREIYATTVDFGVFYSNNAGASWKQILNNFNAYDIAIDPTNADRLYVVGQSGAKPMVLLSTNKGKSWEEIYNDAADANSARSIALDPADSRTIVVGLNSGNLIGSRDSGASWSLLNNFQSPVTFLLWHPDNTLFILARTKGVYASRDSGRTVKSVSTQLTDFQSWRQQLLGPTPSDKPIAQTPNLPTSPSSTLYRLAVSAENSQVLYLAADNGLFTSVNGGATWAFLQLPLHNSAGAPVRGLALAKNDTWVYASVGNTLFKTENGGKSWRVTAIATQATINYILVDPSAPQVAYAGFIGASQ